MKKVCKHSGCGKEFEDTGPWETCPVCRSPLKDSELPVPHSSPLERDTLFQQLVGGAGLRRKRHKSDCDVEVETKKEDVE